MTAISGDNMTTNLTDELSTLLANSLSQYTNMRDQVLARMQEIEKEKAELSIMKAKLDGLLGTESTKTEPTAKAKRGPVKRGPRKRAEATTAATETQAPAKNRVDRDAMTTAVVDVVREKGPIDIKSIVETIGTQVRGIRYDTVAKILADHKDQLKVQGERPRLYSVA